MKILKNKYFILGNILLILLIIPLTLFFISKTQENRSSAAPSTILSLSPSTNQAKKGQQFPVKVIVNPGQNIVSIVDMYILFDASKLKLVSITPNKDAFQTTLRGPNIQAGSANLSVNIGSDSTKAITTTTTVATLLFEALDNTTSGPVKISFDQAVSRVFSLSVSDGPSENVLQSTQPADVTISDTGALTPTISGAVGPGTPTPTTGTGGTNPTGTTGGGTGLTPTPTTLAGLSPTTSPTASASPTSLASAQVPVCTSLNVDRNPSGTAPFNITFTVNGTSPVNAITRVAFDFGDGPAQVLTSTGGIGTTSIALPVSHTYNNAGTYTATVTLTDSSGLSSVTTSACQKTVIVVPGSGTTSGNTSGGTQTGGTGQAKPTLAATGSVASTLGIIGGILFTIIGGAILLAL